MDFITEISTSFPEEILLNTLNGNIVNGDVTWKKDPILIHLEKIEASQLLFNLNDAPLRINVNHDRLAENDLVSENPAYFNCIFWIAALVERKIEIKYLKCGFGQKFNSDLDIGFGDNILLSNKGKKIEKFSSELKNEFVYKSGNKNYIFIQTYPGRTEQSFTIYGKSRRIDVVVIENKWIIQKIKNNKPFPKKHSDFIELNIVQYNEINFVEYSKAKEAYEAIREEEKKGNTLISLWQKYSEIELSRSHLLKDKVGELKLSKIANLPEGVTRIKIDFLNDDLKGIIIENKDDLINSSFEKALEPNEHDQNNTKERFKIKSINTDYSIDIHDDLYAFHGPGAFSLTILGDEIVNKRRERALKSLREDRKIITRNLLFAIEGVNGAMLEKKRNEKALTDRTRKFLKDKFGIDGLTQNQKDAVEIAINTPDIAIIQGPPGTGKSTVVAAICDRLIEIAEKGKRNTDSKLILVSAFQNDTVEHIASKIYTMGLPTIKIGKENQGNIRAEEKLIEEIRLNIDNALQYLSAKSHLHRVSKRLKELKSIYLSEKNEKEVKQQVSSILATVEISNELWNAWKEISTDLQYNEASNLKNELILKGLRTEVNSYDDDGFYKIQKLLKSSIPFTIDERDFLESAPVDKPEILFLEKLLSIKEKYLEEINTSTQKVVSGNNLSLISWLEEAIIYYTTKEEISYEDEDTFITANLEALREELEGNVDFIRQSIKDYGESLAATNQIAGGREMSHYNSIENVIMEEAARSNPLDLLIPMAKATERIIMVGDQNQLPHLLEDDIADETSTLLTEKYKSGDVKKQLEESLFGVIFRNLLTAKPRRTITLTEQFRMHPFIGDFISRVYYDEQIKSGLPNQNELKKHNLQIDWAKEKVAVFCNVPKRVGTEQRGKSKSRLAEAVRIIKLLDELKTDPDFDNISIGVITFYAKQVDELFNEALKKGYAERKPDGTFQIVKQYKETTDKREKLRIGSVDSFQGKEFDIVILSTVRSNDIVRNLENYRKVFGFLTLGNRLNVAFSRAQKLIIVVGDSEMFSNEYAKTYVEGLYEFYNHLSSDQIYGNRIQ